MTGRERRGVPAIADTATGPISVIGYDGSPLRPAARRALHASDLVVGSLRALDAVGVPERAQRVLLGDDPRLAYARLTAHVSAGSGGPATVVTGGDPGFFGAVRTLRSSGFEVVTYPAGGAVAAAFGRIGVPWDDAIVVEVSDDTTLQRAANIAWAHPKVAVVPAPEYPPHKIAAALRSARRTVAVLQNLGEIDEDLERFSPAEAAARTHWGETGAVLVLDDERLFAEPLGGPRWGQGWASGWAGGPANGWAVPDNAFVARGPQVLPAEVRALVLARLAPRLGALVWEVGAGAGAIGVECARLGAAVVAVERDADACERIALNAVMHGVQIDVAAGQAPGALAHLPAPDAVFVGTDRADVIRACATTGARIVVAAVTAVDRVTTVKQALRVGGRKVDGVLLQASRLATVQGDALRMATANPVFVLWGELG
jgi:precorrin-6Y C5,15-methyltransferase (decarboxylating)